MKKLILGVLGLFVGAIVVVVLLAATKPDTIHLERSVVVAATPADMAPFAEDLKKVNAWSPWMGRDPNQTVEYSESTSGVGAYYTWDGNDEVGAGKMTVTVSEPGKVVHELEFLRPFESTAQSTIRYAAEGDGVKVTWAFDQDADFPTKIWTVFASMEDMLGPDYEAGLAKLQPMVEAAATERAAAAKAAEAAAAAATEAAAAAVQAAAQGQ